MKIFITGLAGFLGSHLADRMLELGHEVVGNDTLIGGYRDNVPQGATFYVTNCCDTEMMVKIMEGCDVVVHTAATAHEGLSVFSPSFITKNIFEASVSTISAAIQCKVKRFVFCTSMARYGDQQTPFTENMKPRPVDPYGIAKVAAEEVLKVLCDTHGMEWNIAVPHNIVGPRQRYDDPFRNVMSIMINRNLQGKRSIIYGDGKQTRCFSYVGDCINCLEKMTLDPNIKYEIINIGPDEGTININELSAKVAVECAGGKNLEDIWPPSYMDDRPREVKHASCSADKARKLLNYETKTDLTQAIAETVDYVLKKGPKPFDYSYPLEIVNDKTPKTWKNRLM
jgi:UDP-glucose 4-epimerase